MTENAKRMSCGKCGNQDFAVYEWKPSGMLRFIVECLNCKSTTLIRPTVSALETAWGDNSEGILCIIRSALRLYFEPLQWIRRLCQR